MKEDRILVIIKNPGEEPRVEPSFDNTLEALQAAVGGYIETITLCCDFCLVINEEGRLKGLPYNTTVCGLPIVGPIVAVGVKGDELCSIKSASVPFVLQMLRRKDD